jgi:hypothetical protein
MQFSKKYGFSPLKTIIQKESIDDDLRNSLWNALQIYYWDKTKDRENYYLYDSGNRDLKILCEGFWLNFFKKPLDTLDDNFLRVLKELRSFFFKCSWYKVYDFIEYIAQNYQSIQMPRTNKEFISRCNFYLEREVSAYRFVDKQIAPITSEEEIKSIEEALKSKINPVRDHLNRSLELLADRKNPDYRNSIKESISAVESLVKVITGSESGTLGKLLKILENKKGLHPSLKEAFSKLYGYTSDKEGIRHALMKEDTVKFEEAKFMLVACSAFVNYVKAKESK